METQDKTTVQWVQDLIAIHITRKEAAHRLYAIAGNDSSMAAKMLAAEKQSQQHLPKLLDELSSYGDGVAADADRNNQYMLLWNNTLAGIDQLLPEDAESIFKQMEEKLRDIYQGLLEGTAELPPSFREILATQWNQLSAGS